MTTIVIIDDQDTSRDVLKKLVSRLEDGLSVKTFSNPIDCLNWVQRHTPDLVLTDYRMPNLNGVEFTQRFRKIKNCTDVPLIMVTCVEDREVRYQALESGASDFLNKPVDHHECQARCNNLLTLRRQQQIIKYRAKWLEKRVAEATEATRVREQETLIRLAKAGEYRDEETGGHVYRMAKYSSLIAEALRLTDEECHDIQLAAPMHDIGKIGIPDNILLKAGKHTKDEFEIMKQHTLIGYDILKDSPSKYLQMGAVIALGHHEKFDGSGYPYGLSQEEIPLSARIVAVADVFDALTSVRPYKAAISAKDSIEYIKKLKATHFDPSCVDAFMNQRDKILKIFNNPEQGAVKNIKH